MLNFYPFQIEEKKVMLVLNMSVSDHIGRTHYRNQLNIWSLINAIGKSK